MPENKGEKIVVKKRGNALGFWFFRGVFRIFGLRAAYSFLYLVCLHYLLFDRQATQGALAYIKRRFPGKNFLSARLQVYRLFISQGQQLIDRYAAVSGHAAFDVQVVGMEQLDELLRQRSGGFILLTAHVGNWQIALTTLKNLNRKVHLVMRPEDNPAVERSLNISRPDDFIRVISPEAELDGVIQIMNALKAGDIVSIMGDRKYGFDGLAVDFLGDKAYLPYGAFTIAAAADCPVVVLLTSRLAYKKYLVDVRNVFNPRYQNVPRHPRPDVSADGNRPVGPARVSKREELRGFVQAFAVVLDKYTQEYPYQCFLFSDIWKK
ncbi:MAG: lysophospholipid acyltransferase family protein [Candidatus Omnitrophota bacterium]